MYDNDKEMWVDIQYRFDVVLDTGSGKPIVVLPGTTTPVNMSSFVLQKLRPNFTGYVYKDQVNTLFDGGNKEGNSGINLLVADKDIYENHKDLYQQYPFKYQVWVPVASNGSFSTSLDSQKTYEAVAVSTPNRFYQFGTGVAITLGQDNTITMPKPNFNGVVKLFGGGSLPTVTNGGMNLQVTENGQTQWMYAPIESDGSFGMQLDDKATCIINQIWYQYDSNDKTVQDNIQLNKTVTVGTNTDSMVLKPNLKAEVDLGIMQLFSSDQLDGGITVRPVYHPHISGMTQIN